MSCAHPLANARFLVGPDNCARQVDVSYCVGVKALGLQNNEYNIVFSGSSLSRAVLNILSYKCQQDHLVV